MAASQANFDRLAQSSLFAGWWYAAPGASCKPGGILRKAFEDGKATILAELPDDDAQRLTHLIRKSTSCDDVQEILIDALHKYQSRSVSKARHWLQRFSRKVTHYGLVLDVLVQHHPEYVSLVWGTFKLLFSAITNHEETTKQLAKACATVADLLPRTQLTIILYPTEDVKAAVAHLYSRILQFIVHAVRWYRQGRTMHMVNAVIRPWKLSFEDDVKEIAEASTAVDNLAKAAARAEQRDMHLQLIQMKSKVDSLASLVEVKFERMEQIATTTGADVRNCLDRLCKIQLAQILSLPHMERLPTSNRALQYCLSMKARRKNSAKSLVPSQDRLEAWAAQAELSFLVTENRSDISARDFFVDLICSFRTKTKFPILWALQSGRKQGEEYSFVDIIRMLLYQALQVNHGAMCSGVNPISIIHLQEAVTVEDWLRLLRRALEGMSLVYIALDADIVRRAMDYNRHNAMVWLEKFSRVLGPDRVKIFVSSLCLDRRYTEQRWETGSAVPILAEGLISGRSGRRPRRTQARAILDPRVSI